MGQFDHPKMKMFSSFSHYKVFPNLYTCMSSAEDSCWSPLTSIADKKTYRSQWGLAAKIWLPPFFKIHFAFSRRKKSIQVLNNFVSSQMM